LRWANPSSTQCCSKPSNHALRLQKAVQAIRRASWSCCLLALNVPAAPTRGLA
jgi:hypothetical protein